MAHPNGTPLHGLVGPAMLQASQLARYQALRSINKNVVEVDKNDVISQKPTSEEERIIVSNAAVVSALEDLFSWIHKDKTQRTSQLSYVESWRFHRAMYRVWIMSTLYGYGSAAHGQRAIGASSSTQEAFLQKFTSQELIQISKVSRFLQSTDSAFHRIDSLQQTTSMDCTCSQVPTSFYAATRSRVLTRCRGATSMMKSPKISFFLLSKASSRSVTLPYRSHTLGQFWMKYVGQPILTGRACGQDDLFLSVDAPCTPNLYNERNWARLKGYLGTPSEIFLKLPSNIVEKALFKALREANYDTLFRELFAHKGDRFRDWTEHDWICLDCLREFFRVTVFRWWRKRKVRAGESVLQDCRHGYYCKDQCFDAGQDHATCFNHLCEPVDVIASLAHCHGR